MRLKASSIYYALFLCVIIGLFLGGMILFSGVNKKLESHLEIQHRLMDNAYSGIEYGLANHQELSSEPQDYSLFGSALDSTTIQRRPWGAYVVIKSHAHHGRKYYDKIVMAGERDANAPNLYLPDHGRSFSICGDTRLEGRCFIPVAGVERAYIEGQNYTGKHMIYGSESTAGRSMPPVNRVFLKEMLSISGEIKPWENSDSVTNSFANEPVKFIDDGIVSLNNTVIRGQVFLEARDSIFVSATADLDQVILKSRVIYVQRGFKGNVQLYATDRIILEDGVQLTYPSVLGIMEERFPEKENAQIFIGEKSQVLGSVFALSDKPNFRLPVQISIEKDAEVHGLVYSQGRTQLKGTVNGSLYTDKFYLETAASRYENHLLNAKILNQLPEDFVYIPLLKKENPLTKIDWLL
ncbi:MAG: hypothetical protein HUJ25_17895 [Crocinitomicaceae bacterium]|nr:hypothetical protein [Crocinitomicaceae bacterium]